MLLQKLTSVLVKKFIPGRKTNSRKGQNGKVLVVGGSYVYHGAPVLSSLAALRAGTDLVYTAVPKINASATRAISPNLIVIPMVDAKLTRGSANKLLGQVQAGMDSATIGMGLSVADEEGLKTLIRELSAQDVRLSLDASALISSILPILPDKNIVLTPHAGEFERMFGVLPSNKIKERTSIVEKYAKEHSVTILLKGPTDVISNGKNTYINPKNLASMTVGGTGDVLSGLVAAMLAKNRNGLESAAAASFVNGLAGIQAQKKNGLHIVATDLIDFIPSVMKPFDKVIR
ncbi:MAG: NAD(P)H-hydrate dehydratase [Nitrososphaeria archaeon]|nr:NAD(P)H-hydrate dehydratase [Nitrososphaeria archaeon]NDB51739.1 NAD(P)H-hydrate dehydratase [Nitrosopumilaceae archaeon]NDB87531.1 NAD(P)H-hydrate dehydratase [Nitrososphaerota archaeon]NDB63336.1 NAD(P)H-hydrate dehydratase [Nitrosopumilaceae archaeon]NDB90203.1 NAD(P)H-hydrate dehydratase [Nitrososphaerota archaeon]